MRNLIIITIILSLFVSFMFSYAYGRDMEKITADDIREDIDFLEGKLGNMDIYIEPVPEGTIHIFLDSKDGKNILVKMIYDNKEEVILKDTYTIYSSGEIFFTHEEIGNPPLSFTVKKDGSLIKTVEVLPEKTPEPEFLTPVPTKEPTVEPASTPTEKPVSTSAPTAEPTAEPTSAPTKEPTVEPTVVPTESPTSVPTPVPTEEPGFTFEERIVFSTDMNDSMDIYTMNTDGTNIHRITDGEYSEIMPFISPDGTKIVYSSNEDKKWNIYTINLDGTGKERITNGNQNDILPIFIDNETIIFQSFREGLPQIYKINMIGKKLERLTFGFTLAMHPALCSGGDKIIFVGEKNGSVDLYSINTDGNGLLPLTHSGFKKAFPSISPDGKKIAFSGNSDGYWDIYIVNISEGTQEKIQIRSEESYYPSFTSDGEWIVFQSLEGRDIELFKVNLQTKDIIMLTDNKADDIQARCQFIRKSN